MTTFINVILNTKVRSGFPLMMKSLLHPLLSSLAEYSNLPVNLTLEITPSLTQGCAGQGCPFWPLIFLVNPTVLVPFSIIHVSVFHKLWYSKYHNWVQLKEQLAIECSQTENVLLKILFNSPKIMSRIPFEDVSIV